MPLIAQIVGIPDPPMLEPTQERLEALTKNMEWGLLPPGWRPGVGMVIRLPRNNKLYLVGHVNQSGGLEAGRCNLDIESTDEDLISYVQLF